MPGVITHPDAVTAEWLTEVLRQSQCLPHGHVMRIATTVENSYTSTIVRLVPTYSRDAPTSAPARLLLKIARLDADQPVVGRNSGAKRSNSTIKSFPPCPNRPWRAATRLSIARRPAPPTCCWMTFPQHIPQASPRSPHPCLQRSARWTPSAPFMLSGGTILRWGILTRCPMPGRWRRMWRISARLTPALPAHRATVSALRSAACMREPSPRCPHCGKG